LKNKHTSAIIEERLSLNERSKFLRSPSSLEFMHKRKDIRAGQNTTHQKSFMPRIRLNTFKVTWVESMNIFMKNIIKVAPTTEESTPMMRLCPANFLNTCHSVLKALEKIIQGRNIAKIPLG
jgi:hypothetical protein